MFGKNRKSVIFLIFSSFWVFYILGTGFQYYLSASDLADKKIQERKDHLNFLLNSSVNALVNKNVEILQEQLKQAHSLRLNDFYILQKNDEIVFFENNGYSSDSLNRKYSLFGKIQENERIAFKTIKILEYTLTIGFFKKKSSMIIDTFLAMKYLFLRDILLVTLFLFLILYFFLKDILRLTNSLANRKKGKIEDIKSQSYESHILLQATEYFESDRRRLIADNKNISGALTPAIWHEIQSGTAAPSLIQTALIRVDLNGYTQIFLDKKDEYITDIMNNYFSKSREIIERYGGYIYQYVGDEIVFHIKQNTEDSARNSFSCIRALFLEAENIEKDLPPDCGHDFKIKASIVFGKMRFVKLDTGYGFSGLPLIESARLLSQVNEKEKNVCVFFETSHKTAQDFFEIDTTQNLTLKGFKESSAISTASEFIEIEEVLAKNKLDFIKFFRRDEELMAILQYLLSHIDHLSERDFFEHFSFISSLKLSFVKPEFIERFSELLISANETAKRKSEGHKILSALVKWASQLIPPQCAHQEFINLLTSFLRSTDHRVCANTIIALGEYDQNFSYLGHFISFPNNRISADALMVLGKKDIDSKIYRKLKSYLKSDKPEYQASARYVVHELLSYYKENDPIFYKNNSYLKKLSKALLESKMTL